MADDEEFLLGVLLLEADALDAGGILGGAAVQDGEFAAVHLDEHIVDAGGIEGGEGVLDGAHRHAVLGDDGAAGGGHDVLGHSVDNGHAVKVNALDDIAVVLGCGHEFGLDLKAGVQALSLHGERVFKR